MNTAAVLSALRNAIDVALFCEAVPDSEFCPNAIAIRALNLTAMGDVLVAALNEVWALGYPPTTPASKVLQAAHDRLALTAYESSF